MREGRQRTQALSLALCDGLMLLLAMQASWWGRFDINEWLLAHSRAIVQDPSGIPFRAFPKEKWTLRFWGRNTQPIEIFAKYNEPDLRDAVDAEPALRLPFGFGYQHEAEHALLILAERTGGE